MTERVSAGKLSSAGGAVLEATPVALRVAILDRDSGFLQVLDKRLERLGWERRVLASSISPQAIVPMRLSAVIVDLAVLGPSCWDWL